MSIEAMKLALEALNEAVAFQEGGRQKAIGAVKALHTAIQQAEAQQLATGEPVGQVSDLFPSVRNKLHAKGFDSDAPLYTHPAPSVPADIDALIHRVSVAICLSHSAWDLADARVLVLEILKQAGPST